MRRPASRPSALVVTFASATVLVAASSCAPAAATAPKAAPPSGAARDSVAAEARALLEGLVATDTSHGHETDALVPVKARLEGAGVAAEIVESAPGRGNLVARLRGDGSKGALLLVAHVDVVPVEGQPWTVAPFRPTEKDGFLWGRGVGDDKAMAAAFTAIVLDLARRKVPLERDVILALTAGEETGGGAGVRWLLQHRPELVTAEIALNEGGGLTLDEGLTKVESVGIGSAEKGMQSYFLTVAGPGGHSSVPPTDGDPVEILSRALVKVAEYKFPAKVLPPVQASLPAAAALEKPPLSDALRSAARSAPALSKEDEAIIHKDRLFNALVRTTCVTTMLEGSPQDNVLPTTARATVNCRILPDETREGTRAALEAVVADPRVKVTGATDVGVGAASPLEGVVPAAITKVAAALWPGVPVVPSMSTGATDSRHLRGAGVLAYGVSAAPTSVSEGRKGHGAHGPDERRPSRWLAEGVRYLQALTAELAAKR